MKRVTAMIRPHRLEDVKAAVAELGVTGMTVSDVRGCGNSPERAVVFGGLQTLSHLPPKSRLEVVVPDDLAEDVIEAILRHAHTGEPGDGKIFVEKLAESIRIRTLERGDSAV